MSEARQRFAGNPVTLAGDVDAGCAPWPPAAEAIDPRAWVLSQTGQVGPSDLQRAGRIPWNMACSILEGLEKDGELVRLPSPSNLMWTVAPKAAAVTSGYSLPLSPKEYGALYRGLGALLHGRDFGILLAQAADFIRGAGTQEERELWCRDVAEIDTRPLKDDEPTLRAIRTKLKRPV